MATRKVTATAPETMSDAELDALVGSIENEIHAEPTDADTEAGDKPEAATPLTSPQAFSELRGIISTSPKAGACAAVFNGRYESGTFNANGRPIHYPFLGARKNLYPENCVSIKAKLDHIASLLPSPVQQVNLLVVDLAKVAVAGGIKLPAHLEPDALKATLLGASGGDTANGGAIEW